MKTRISKYLVLLWTLISFACVQMYLGGLYFSKSTSNAQDNSTESTSTDFYKEFVWPKNEPIIELKQKVASLPRIPPLLSNMRSVDESKLPYKCGLIFFYHIACTGGSSINHWFGKQIKLNGPNTSYWTKWGRNERMEANFITGMTNQTKGIGPNEWRFVHAHGMSYFPNASEAYLYQWREEVESQGCGFIVTTMLRDAIGHTISQSKGMIKLNATIDEYLSHLEPQNYNQRFMSDGGMNFVTQLDYLLYNIGPRNQYNATKEEKVRRAIEILQRHFDVVSLGDHEMFTAIMNKITGWKPLKKKASNIFKGELNYSYAELQKIKDLTEANGDVLFIDAVKQLYYPQNLDFLL